MKKTRGNKDKKLKKRCSPYIQTCDTSNTAAPPKTNPSVPGSNVQAELLPMELAFQPIPYSPWSSLAGGRHELEENVSWNFFDAGHNPGNWWRNDLVTIRWRNSNVTIPKTQR